MEQTGGTYVPPRTDVQDYFHLAASLYALWRIPADVECYLLSSPATASTDTSLPQLYVSIPISCLAVFPFLLLTYVTLLEKRVALEVTALQNLFATSVKHENRPAFLCWHHFYCFYKGVATSHARIFEFRDAVPVRHLYRRRRDVKNTRSS